jgi:hypothetical protein
MTPPGGPDSSKNAQTNTPKSSEASALDALFRGELAGMIAALPSDEKPVRGLLGQIDWHFEGQISKLLKKGFIQGKPGECTYIPLIRGGKRYSLVLLGIGTRAAPLAQASAETLQSFSKNIQTLRVRSLGISRKDFGDSFHRLEKVLTVGNQEGEVWTLP